MSVEQGQGTKLNEQLFAYVRSAGFPCSETGVVRLEGRRIGVRVYARYNEEECVLVQGRHRRVFARRAHGGVIHVGDPSARLQLLAALFLEEIARIDELQEAIVDVAEKARLGAKVKP